MLYKMLLMYGQKLALSGYAINIGLNGVYEGMKNYNIVCPNGMSDGLNCFALNLTNLSLNTFVIASVGAAGVQLYKIVKG